MERTAEQKTHALWIANMLRYIAVFSLIVAIFAGFIVGVPSSKVLHDTSFHWVPALIYWVCGATSFALMFGFAELIDINADTRRMLAQLTASSAATRQAEE